MAASPFIDGTTIQWAWDSTSLGWLKECPRKYYYHMVLGWVSKAESVHLEFGILYHKALETYDKYRYSQGIFYRDADGRFETPIDHDRALRAVVHETMIATWRDGAPWRASADLDPDDKTSLKCRENLIRTICWYLDKFPAERDPARTAIASDTGRPKVELHFQFEVDIATAYGLIEYPYTLCGYLDRVVTFQDINFVMDRKTTTSTVAPYYFEQYDPDNQISLYTIAAEVAFHTPVKGVIIDAAQIAVGFSRFNRSFSYRTKEQSQEWLNDFGWWMLQAKQLAKAGYWPMNDKSCHKYGGCTFRRICTKSPSVRDKFLETDFEKRVWNPLIPR